MPNINEILDILESPSKEDIKLIAKAYDFAMRAHDGQLRKSGEPYFVHVFETAKNLANFHMDSNVIAAGFLHDVLEDTEIKENEMRSVFGDDITNMVLAVTKLGTLKYKGIERNIENLRKFFISMADDIRGLIIKLADRLHNIETLKHVRPDKQKRIAM